MYRLHIQSVQRLKAVTLKNPLQTMSTLISPAATQYTGQPITIKIPDLINFFVIKDTASNYVHISSSLNLSSDHSPVRLLLPSSTRTIRITENPN